MSVIGIEKLEFGVDNLAACQQFLQDFGLQTSPNNPSYFTTLSGASVALSSIDDPRLPTPFESGSTLRRITWGVKDRVTLEQVIKQIEDCAGFQLTSDGAQCLDPNGMTVAFTISQQQDVTVDISLSTSGEIFVVLMRQALFMTKQPPLILVMWSFC